MVERRKAPQGCYWRGETLWGRFEVQGVEHRRSLRTGEAKVAEGRLKAARDEAIAALRFGESRPSWKDAIVSWSDSVGGHTKPTTAKRYMVSLKQLEPYLADRFIDEIDRTLIGEIVRLRRAAGTSTATIRRDLTALSSVMSHCEDEGWRTDNPALSRLRKLKERRDPIVLPEPAHVEMVIAKAPGLLKAVIRTAWLTGCRQDEIRRMERRHLNFQRGQISIYKTKTGRARVIDMREAEAVLEKVPIMPGCDFVFWHGAGETYRNISSNFRRLVESAQRSAQKKRLDFRPFRFHDLRHLFAVEWLKNGNGIYELSRHLGHTSVKTTEIYLAYLTGDEAEAAMRGSAQNPAREQRSIRVKHELSD